MKLFFDGGCRPAGLELAVVTGGKAHVRQGLGPGTGMDAEWLALIEAMRLAHERGIADPLLLGDAAAVIAQVTGAAKCPAAYARHHDALRSLPRPAGRVRIRWIKRTQNLAGIALAALHER
ncbi:MAG: reverse transcriptase-like protein [Janthinobacterium lividum]